MVLCKHCIETMKKRGKKLLAAEDILCTMEEAKEENQPCENCGEFAELYFAWNDPNA